MSSSLKVKIILGSTRQGRFSEKPAAWILNQMKGVADLETEVLDLREYPLPFFEEPLSPSMMKEPYANPVVQKWTAKIAEADAFVIIAPEYNHGYPAVLKNALDYVGSAWNKKAVGFIGYGSVGGARSIEQLRQVVAELQMVSIRSSLHIFGPMYMEVSKEAVGAQPSALDVFKDGAGKFIEQLVWWAKALKSARGQQ